MVRMQATLGGGVKSLHPAVVELDGLYHVVSLPNDLHIAFRGVFPAGIWEIRAARDGAQTLAVV